MGEVLLFNRSKLQVISEKEAAAVLGLSYCTLRRMRLDDNGPPHIKLGVRRIGYRLSTMDAWLDARERSQASPDSGSRSNCSRGSSSVGLRKVSHRSRSGRAYLRARAA